MQLSEQLGGMMPSPLNPLPNVSSFVSRSIWEQDCSEIRLVMFPNFLERFTVAMANLLNVLFPLRSLKQRKIDTTIQSALSRQRSPEQF